MNYDDEFLELMRKEQTEEEKELDQKEKEYERLRQELVAQRGTLQKNYQAIVGRKHENELLQVVVKDYADYYKKVKDKMEEVNTRMNTINQYLEKVIQENKITDYKMGHVLQDRAELNKNIESYRTRINQLL
jgi:hypothetical protein